MMFKLYGRENQSAIDKCHNVTLRDVFFFVKLEIILTFGEESLVEFAGDGFVLRRVTEENAKFAVSGGHKTHLSGFWVVYCQVGCF